MRKQKKYNYIKIVDGKYGPFMELLYQITRKDVKTYQQPAGNFIVITEAALVDPDEEVDLTQAVDYRNSKHYPYIVAVPDECNYSIHYGINIGAIYYMDSPEYGEVRMMRADDVRLGYGEYVEYYELSDASLWDHYNTALNEYFSNDNKNLSLIEILAAHDLFINYPSRVTFTKVKSGHLD